MIRVKWKTPARKKDDYSSDTKSGSLNQLAHFGQWKEKSEKSDFKDRTKGFVLAHGVVQKNLIASQKRQERVKES